jgi:transcription initiation factor TFIIIB Brf1 subunit/transcription initiation factor TFIIB
MATMANTKGITAPAHQPTDQLRQQVSVMVEIGMRQEEMSRVLGISEHTLRKHYEKELENAKAILNSAVANNLYRIATSSEKGAVAAAIFWMKTRARWKETIDLSNDDGSMKPETVQLAVMAALNKAHKE